MKPGPSNVIRERHSSATLTLPAASALAELPVRHATPTIAYAVSRTCTDWRSQAGEAAAALQVLTTARLSASLLAEVEVTSTDGAGPLSASGAGPIKLVDREVTRIVDRQTTRIVDQDTIRALIAVLLPVLLPAVEK